MSCIFCKKEFTLCSLPLPENYPYSQTHSGVAYFKGKYYLTTSPFPSIKRNRFVTYVRAFVSKISFGVLGKPIIGELYENPFLYVGINNKDGNPASKFKLMQHRPLQEIPEYYYGLPAFNSDPDIYIEDNNIYVLNRTVYRTKLCPGEVLNKYEIRIHLISGTIDSEKFKFSRDLVLINTEDSFVSPCLSKYLDNYILMYMDTASYLDGLSFNGLYIMKALNIDGFMCTNTKNKVKVIAGSYLPWHMSVFHYQSKMYAIVACVKRGEAKRCWQMLGEFNEDLSELNIYQTPLTDYNSYRGAACVREDGEFVLYTTTVHEKLKGSNSVDGREVIMAHMSFKELIIKLKNNEINE